MKTKLMIVMAVMGAFMALNIHENGLINQAFAEDKKPQGKKDKVPSPAPEPKPQEQTRPDLFANMDSKDKALIEAAMKRDLAAVQAAVDSGADVNAKGPGNNTALLFSVKSSPDIVKYLLSKKADPNVVNNNGVTPLSVAKKNNLADTIKMLTDAGAKEQP